jgi:hypothetical protein
MKLSNTLRLFLLLMPLLCLSGIQHAAFGQGSGAYERLFTIAGSSISDTISGMNMTVSKVFPFANHGDVSVEMVQAGGGGNAYVYAVHYTPDSGFVGLDTFTLEYVYIATYPFLVYRAYVVDVCASRVQAVRDFALTPTGTPTVVDVLTNDIGEGLTLSGLTVVNHGAAAVDGNQIRFSPKPGFEGVAHVQYTTCDTEGTCAIGQLHIIVHGPAVPGFDTLRLFTTQHTTLTTPLPRGGFSLLEAPSNGTVSLTEGMAITYTPDPLFVGTDQVVLIADTGAHATFLVLPIRTIASPPRNRMAMDDVLYTPIGQPVSGNVLLNDVGNLPVRSWVFPPNLPGTVTGNGSNGAFTFTPNPNFKGLATFYYRIGNMHAPNLEMGSVHIAVDNLPPRSNHYRFNTLPETPFVLQYNLPFDGYSFQVVEAPIQGVLTFHPGLTEHQIQGQTVTGVNLLIYEPDAGFSGTDVMAVDYCATPGDSCSTHTLRVSVIDPDADPPYCVSDCVWAGDANRDGIVNNLDMLAIGRAMGAEGPYRAPAPADWVAQFGTDWLHPFQAPGPDLKHADTDGNGVVNSQDTLALTAFYGLTHQMQPRYPAYNKGLPFRLDIRTVLPGAGDRVEIDVYLGWEHEPVVDLTGFAFDLRLSPNIVDSAMHMRFSTDAWINRDAPYISFQQRPQTGRLETAFVRTNGQGASGYGYIGTVEFIIIEVIEGGKPDARHAFTITMDTPHGAYQGGETGLGEPLTVEVPLLEAERLSSVRHTENGTGLRVFPNPASTALQVRADEPMIDLQLFDASGRIALQVSGIHREAVDLQVAHLPKGMYALRVTTEGGVMTRLVQIQ